MASKIKTISLFDSIRIRASKTDEIRNKNGNNTIVLFQVGDNYEAYEECAEAIHDICGTPLIYQGNTAFTDFKTECDFWIFPKMIREHYKLCIIEQNN